MPILLFMSTIVILVFVYTLIEIAVDLIEVFWYVSGLTEVWEFASSAFWVVAATIAIALICKGGSFIIGTVNSRAAALIKLGYYILAAQLTYMGVVSQATEQLIERVIQNHDSLIMGSIFICILTLLSLFVFFYFLTGAWLSVVACIKGKATNTYNQTSS
jgi:hypothetical protein